MQVARSFFVKKMQRILKLWMFFGLCLLCLPAISASVDANRFQAYVEKHANGWIDWQQGKIYGIGRGYLKINRNSRPASKGVASVLASGSIMKLAAGVHLDDTSTLATIGRGRVVINLKAFMHDKEYKSRFVDEPDPYYEVINVASISGVTGLTAKLLNTLKGSEVERDFPIPKGPRSSENLGDENEDWLVLDARNLPNNQKVEPALFPKIVSEKGEVIHQLSEVEAAALYNRGMIQYTVSDESKLDLRSEGVIDNILARAGSLLAVPEAQAAWGFGRRKKRGKYIVKDVVGLQGLSRTNLVVSAKDAKKIKKEDRSSKILKKCRVLVIVSSPVGGIEGGLDRFLARNMPDGSGTANLLAIN